MDALVVAYKVGTKTEVNRTRTYGDTSQLYLPAGSYDLKAKPLEGSDVAAITITRVPVAKDKASFQLLMAISNFYQSVFKPFLR